MAKKQDQNVQYINIGGKQSKIVVQDNYGSRMDSSRSAGSSYDEGIRGEIYNKLHDNPFMYNYKKATFKVTSIEEFYIFTAKKKTAPLGAVLRGNEIKRNKRKPLIQKAFAKWKKEFIKKKEQTLTKEDSKMSVVGEVVAQKIPFMTPILLGLIFFIVCFFRFQMGDFWTLWPDAAWFVNVQTGLDTAFSQPWMDLASSATLYMAIIALLYAGIYNSVIGEFKKISSISKALYKKYAADIQKDFKKKFRNTRNYYLRATSKRDPRKVAIYPIEKTAQGNIDLESVESMTEMYMIKSAQIKKRKGILGMFKFLTIYVAYLGGIGIVGYVLYSIVISFF